MAKILEEDVFKADREKESTKKLLGQMTIPNVRINCLDFDDGLTLKRADSIFLNSLEGYYEEYNSRTGWKVILSTQTLALENYELLTKYSHFSIDTEEIYRDTNNNDIKISNYRCGFNNITIQHKLYCDGEPTVWYITLFRKPYEYKEPPKKDEKPKSVTEEKRIQLRSTHSNTLGEVKL